MFVAITRNENGLGASVHVTEQEGLNSVGKSLGLDAPHTQESIEEWINGDEGDDTYEFEVHPISLDLFSHVSDPIVRLALITHDPKLADQARGRTFSAWWSDNNEGEQIAQSLSSRVYGIRENAILGMGDDSTSDDPVLSSTAIPEDFWKHLTDYWMN